MDTVLITGGNGFLGSYIARDLLNLNKKVVVLDLSDNNTLLSDISDRIKFIKSNLTDWNNLEEVFSKNCITEVYHVAVMVAPFTEEDLMAAFENNVCGTLNLLELSRIFGVRNFFYGSSNGVYGNRLTEGNVVDEDAPQFPWHMYGTTKVCCERLGEQYFRKYSLNFRGLRFPPIFGLERKTKGPTGFCDSVVREALCGRPYIVNVEPDTPIASAISVQDAASASINLMDADEERLTRRIYNIGSMSFTARELVDEVRKQIPGVQISFAPDAAVSDNLRKWPATTEQRARNDWDWTPKHCNVSSYVSNFIAEFKSKRK